MKHLKKLSRSAGRRVGALLVALALLTTSGSLDFRGLIAAAGSTEEPIVYTLKRGIKGSVDLRTMTGYGTRNWAYVENTVSHNPEKDPVTQLESTLQLRAVYNGEWVALKIQIPRAGIYSTEIEYMRNYYGGAIMETYIFPMTGTPTKASIAAGIAENTTLGEVICFDGSVSASYGAEKELEQILIAEPGEYLLVFRASGMPSGSKARTMFPVELTLTPDHSQQVTMIESTPVDKTLFVGNTTELETTITFDNGMQYTGKGAPLMFGTRSFPLALTSLTPEIATIDQDGKVRGVSTGMAQIGIALETQDGTLEATAQIQVEQRVLHSITFTTDTAPFYETTERAYAVTLYSEDGNAFEAAQAQISVVSSNPGIVTVRDGMLVAMVPGEAQITATVSLDGVECNIVTHITVQPVLFTSIELLPTDRYLTPGLVGARIIVTPKNTLGYEIKASDMSVEWSSASPEIIEVDDEGYLTPISLGQAEVIAQVTIGEIILSESITLTVLEEQGAFEYPFFDEGTTGKDLRTINEYGAEEWKYAADTVTYATNPVMQIKSCIQLRTARDQWVALKLRVPEAGTYYPFVTHNISEYGGRFETYLFPATEDLTREQIEAGMTEQSLLGESDGYSVVSGSKTKVLKMVDIPQAGEYVLVFLASGATSGAKSNNLYIVSFGLDPNDVQGAKSLEVDLSKKELIAGEYSRITGRVALTTGVRYPIRPPEFPVGTESARVSFSTTNPGVIAVDEFGIVTGVAPGIAGVRVRVAIGEVVLQRELPVTVNSKKLNEVRASLGAESLYVTQKIRPDITMFLDDGNLFIADGAEITLESEDLGVVQPEGDELRAIAVGETTVHAHVTLGGTTKTDSFSVIVLPERFDRVLLTAERRYLKPGDDTIQLAVQLQSNAGNPVDSTDAFITYTSSDTTVAAVDDGGQVSSGRLGQAEITAEVTLGGVTRSDTLSVIVKEGKVGPTYYTMEKRAIAQENIKKYDWAKSEKERVIQAAEKYLGEEEFLWNSVVGEGIPRASAVSMSNDPKRNLCKYCGADLLAKYGYRAWLINVFSNPWKIQCPSCKRRFPSNDFAALYKLGLDENGIYNRELAHNRNDEQKGKGGPDLLKNTLYPEMGSNWGVDDGWGYYVGYTYSQTEAEIHAYIPNYVHVGLWDSRRTEDALYPDALNILGKAYLYTGDMRYGRVGAIMIDRFADIYPDLHLMPYNTIYSNSHGLSGEGKAIGRIWEAQKVAPMLAIAYDTFYPAMDDPYVVDFLNKKAVQYKLENDKSTSEKIRENGERGILRAIYEGCTTAEIYGNFGMHQKALALAAVVYDKMPESAEWIDWIFSRGVYTWQTSVSGGDVMPTLVEKVSRDGLGNEVGLGYNNIWLDDLLGTALVLNTYGSTYPTADLFKNPKFVKMFSGSFPMATTSNYYATIGDSGSTAVTGIGVPTESIKTGFEILGTPELGQMLYFRNGNKIDGLHGDIFTKNPGEIGQKVLEVINQYGEYDFSPSTNISGYGLAVLRGGGYYSSPSDAKALDTQRSFWMYYGATGTAHSHADKLNLGIDAYGLNMAPDLGYPESADKHPNNLQWVTNTVSHNTVVVNDTKQSKVAHNGTPLRFDDAKFVKVIDVDAPEAYDGITDIYRRTVVMVEVNEEVAYGVDFFRVKGGNHHLYSFHSQSDEISETLGLGEMTPQTDVDGSPIGSYAGADVTWGAQTSSTSGYNWLYNVRRSQSVEDGKFTVDFKVKDFRRALKTPRNLHLRMTMFAGGRINEVAFANGNAPNTASNSLIKPLEYVLVSRRGSNLDTLFTTVFEPYDTTRYIAEIETVSMERLSGAPDTKDAAKAVRITHKNSSRVDYVVYATNNSVTYSVDGGAFEFSGIIGVYTLVDGEPVYIYLNDGTKLGKYTADIPSVSGRVFDFTREMKFENSITILPSTVVDPETLTGKSISVKNDGNQNAFYRIERATATDNNRLVLHLGNNTLIRSYRESENITGGYNYNIKQDDDFRIPLSYSWSSAPKFMPSKDYSVDARSGLRFTVSASSPVEKPLSYNAVLLPRGAAFDEQTRTVSWVPDERQVGTHHVGIRVTDGSLTDAIYIKVNVLGATTPGKGTTTPGKGTTTPGGGTTTPGGGTSTPGGGTSTPGERFVDLTGFDWARDAIKQLSAEGIIQGTSENTYSPSRNITRADFTLLLARGLNLTGTSEERFADVAEDAYYAEALSAARNAGIIKGKTGNLFDPVGQISRQDMMLILYRTLDALGRAPAPALNALDEYSDSAEIAPYAVDAVSALVSAGIVGGANGRINPNGYATRAEVAVLLHRVIN